MSETLEYRPLDLAVAPITNITTDGAFLEAEILQGTYTVDDYYVAIKRHDETTYRTNLFNDEHDNGSINIDCTFRDLEPGVVYDYRVYVSNVKSETKTYEGSFRTLSMAATGSVYGSVTYADGVSGQTYPIYVSLYEGNTVIASTRLDSEDNVDYLFTNISDGSYRVVATNGIMIETAACALTNGGVTYPSNYAALGGVNLVLNGYNTSVVIEDDSINITADNLESIYDNSIYKGILTNQDIAVLNNGGRINISLHARYIDVADISSEEMSVFNSRLSENTVIEKFINLYVVKEVWNAEGQYVNGTPIRVPELYNPITVTFPLGELAGQEIYVASVHGDGASYSFINYADDVEVTPNYVTISTRYFSVYALYRVLPSDKEYTVTWKDGDGNIMKTETVAEGKSATPPQATPVKTATAEYTYQFSGWDTDYSSVTSDMVIAAWFTAHKRDAGGAGDGSGSGSGAGSGSGDNAGTGDNGTTGGNKPADITTNPNAYTYLGSSYSPNTGDVTDVMAIAVIMLMSLGAIVIFTKKLHKANQ